jgi:hypothetical protein
MENFKAEHLCEISAELEEPQEIGATPHGIRRILYVKGGTFEGPKLKGEVLAGGGDWILLRPDGAGELDVRGTLQTDDGHLIYFYYRGIFHASPEVFQRVLDREAVDPSEYYFRTTPIFETSSEKYGWLNRIISVGVGEIKPGRVSYSVYNIL